MKSIKYFLYSFLALTSLFAEENPFHDTSCRAYYKDLGVTDYEGSEAIKKAYLERKERLQKKIDSFPEDAWVQRGACQQALEKLGEAFLVLYDREKKREYDAFLKTRATQFQDFQALKKALSDFENDFLLHVAPLKREGALGFQFEKTLEGRRRLATYDAKGPTFLYDLLTLLLDHWLAYRRLPKNPHLVTHAQLALEAILNEPDEERGATLFYKSLENDEPMSTMMYIAYIEKGKMAINTRLIPHQGSAPLLLAYRNWKKTAERKDLNLMLKGKRLHIYNFIILFLIERAPKAECTLFLEASGGAKSPWAKKIQYRDQKKQSLQPQGSPLLGVLKDNIMQLSKVLVQSILGFLIFTLIGIVAALLHQNF